MLTANERDYKIIKMTATINRLEKENADLLARLSKYEDVTDWKTSIIKK